MRWNSSHCCEDGRVDEIIVENMELFLQVALKWQYSPLTAYWYWLGSQWASCFRNFKETLNRKFSAMQETYRPNCILTIFQPVFSPVFPNIYLKFLFNHNDILARILWPKYLNFVFMKICQSYSMELNHVVYVLT